MSLIDWDLAAATAARLVRPGPQVSFEEAAGLVDELRGMAREAAGHVSAFTGLRPAEDTGDAKIVDRPGWVRANVAGFQMVLDPVVDQLLAKRRNAPGGAVVQAIGSKVTGAQLGAVLAYLASRVLGQYELFLPPGEGSGRLTLVAPNILEVERQLGVDGHDFRLWVCLHEATHQLQFTAVPWLREHVQQEMTTYMLASDLDPARLAARIKDAASAVADTVRGKGELSLIEALQTPEQRAILDRVTGLMSLLEGHGDYVMDGVGPEVVPSVAEIRQRFQARRTEAGGVERAMRRLLGFEMKMKQYAEGEAFVRTVIERVGMAGFNRVWERPGTLPDRAEIRDPLRWLARVDGLPGEPPAVSA